ncbi:MAG: RteC domain-containing protein [Niastella sp.]|nr:RteC domain-containing protein [Niastella sp.]
MNNHQSDLLNDFQSLLNRLQETEDQPGDLLTRLDTCIRLCSDSLRQFRQSVIEHGFPDQATEIYFFKYIKPGVLGRYTFYRLVHQLHLGELKGCRRHEKERLTKELAAISLAFERNAAFWQYYRSGSMALDEQYFLRGSGDWKIQPLATHFDDLFSTCCDGQLAELLAFEQLMAYIDERLSDNGDAPTPPVRNTTAGAIRCTATVSEIIELGYALHLAGFFDNGKASIKRVMVHLQETWQVDLSNYYHTFAQLAERKQPARFLNRLLQQYSRYLDNKID